MSIHGHSDPDKTPEPVDCVFLWHTPPCREAVRRAGARVLRLYTANSLPQARQLLLEKDARVLLVEASDADPAWMGTVSQWSQSDGSSCWIPVMMQFDGARWVELLEHGAFDVLCAPIDSLALQRMVVSADWKARLQDEDPVHMPVRFKPQ